MPLMEEQLGKKSRDDLTVMIALLVWTFGMTFLKDLRHHLSLIWVLGLPILFSGLITLVPDKRLQRRQRIGWRIAVITTGILYSCIILLLISKGK